MNNKPSLAKDTYSKYVSDDGEVTVPKDDHEKKLLARALIGKEFVSQFDSWLSYSNDLIYKEPEVTGRSKSISARIDKYFHTGLKPLTDEQKNVVKNLVREISTGVLFSTLVGLDQCDFGDCHLSMLLKNSGIELDILPGTKFDLHDELHDWMLSFSKYGDEIYEIVETRHGWQYKTREFFQSNLSIDEQNTQNE